MVLLWKRESNIQTICKGNQWLRIYLEDSQRLISRVLLLEKMKNLVAHCLAVIIRCGIISKTHLREAISKYIKNN